MAHREPLRRRQLEDEGREAGRGAGRIDKARYRENGTTLELVCSEGAHEAQRIQAEPILGRSRHPGGRPGVTGASHHPLARRHDALLGPRRLPLPVLPLNSPLYARLSRFSEEGCYRVRSACPETLLPSLVFHECAIRPAALRATLKELTKLKHPRWHSKGLHRGCLQVGHRACSAIERWVPGLSCC